LRLLLCLPGSRAPRSRSPLCLTLAGIVLLGAGCDDAQIYEGYVVEDAQPGAREVPRDEKIVPGALHTVPEVWVRIATLGQSFPPMRADKDGHWHCAQLWGSSLGKSYRLDLSVQGPGYEPCSTTLLVNDGEMKHTILVRVRRDPQ